MKAKMKIITILLALLAFVPVFADEAKSPFMKKLNSLLETVETEADDALTAELTSYGMRMKIASVFRQEAEKEGWIKEEVAYYINCIGMNNLKLLNAFRLSDTIVFGNYKLNPEEEVKYNRFVYLTYDTAAHKILCLKTSISNYSDLVFHKYTFGKKCVLYAIKNDSSLGSWSEELILTVLSASDLKEIVSEECVYYKSWIVGGPPEMECIEYKKDFDFAGDRLHLKGTDFDYHAWKYVPYEKEYRLF